MSFFGIIASVLIATIAAQAATLLIVGSLQNEPFAIGALPMTLIFFALPAFFWSTIFVLVTNYGLKLVGGTKYVPIAVGILAIIFFARASISPPENFKGQVGGFHQAVGWNIIGALILRAIYAQIRLSRS